MSVQSDCPFDVPRRVRCEILGREVVADVVADRFTPDWSRAADTLTVEHQGSRYRVDASDAEPA